MAHRPAPVSDSLPQSLCLLRLSAIGDCCNLVPVVRTLQAARPQARLTWIIGGTEGALLGDLDGVESIIHDKTAGRAGLRRTLGGRRFDALLLMQVALRAGWVSTAVRAPLRIGFDRARARDGHGLFVNRRVPATGPGHVIDGFFAFAEALGIRERVLRWDIPVPETAAAAARGLIPDGQPALVISPCSSQRFRNFRNWRLEHYVTVARHAIRRHGMQVLVTGGGSAEERRYGEGIAAAVGAGATDLVGRTGLKTLFALLGRATAVLAPDSGPVHMAVAAGTPAIGLYATSNPERTGPVLGRRWVVNAYPDAVRQAFGREVAEVRWGRRVRSPGAMDLITPEAVTERLDRLLATPARERLAA